MSRKKDETSKRVLKILMDKIKKGEKLTKHEREILAVVSHVAHEHDSKRKSYKRKRKHVSHRR